LDALNGGMLRIGINDFQDGALNLTGLAWVKS